METLSPSERPQNALIVDNQLSCDQPDRATESDRNAPDGNESSFMLRPSNCIQPTAVPSNISRLSGDLTQAPSLGQNPVISAGELSTRRSSSVWPHSHPMHPFDSSVHNSVTSDAGWELQDQPVDLSKPARLNKKDGEASYDSLASNPDKESNLRCRPLREPSTDGQPHLDCSSSLVTCNSPQLRQPNVITSPTKFMNSLQDTSLTKTNSIDLAISKVTNVTSNSAKQNSELKQAHSLNAEATEEVFDHKNMSNVNLADINLTDSIIIPFPEIECNENLDKLLESSQNKMIILSVDAPAGSNSLLIPPGHTQEEKLDNNKCLDAEEMKSRPQLEEVEDLERLESSSPEKEVEYEALEDINCNTEDDTLVRSRKDLVSDTPGSRLIAETLSRIDSDENIDITDIFDMLKSDSGSNREDLAASAANRKKRKRTLSYRIRTNRMLDTTVTEDETEDEKLASEAGLMELQTKKGTRPVSGSESPKPTDTDENKSFADRSSLNTKRKPNKTSTKQPKERQSRCSGINKENRETSIKSKNDSGRAASIHSSRRSLRISQRKESQASESIHKSKRRRKTIIINESESEPDISTPSTPAPSPSARTSRKATPTAAKSSRIKCKEYSPNFHQKKEVDSHTNDCPPRNNMSEVSNDKSSMK